jgi:hypothetical protein
METRRFVRTIEVNIYCDKCSEDKITSFLQFTGICKPLYPPLYVYECSLCQKKLNFKRHYPYIEYEEIEG